MRAGVGLNLFPAPDRLRDGLGIPAGGDLHQHRVDHPAVFLTAEQGIDQSRNAGPVQRRIGQHPRPFVEQGVVILEELDFLRVTQRDEHHRIAAGRYHPLGQANHGVAVAANPDRVAKLKAGFDIGYRFVMGAFQRATGDQVTRLAGFTGPNPDQHRPNLVAGVFNLQGQISDIGGPQHPRQAPQAAIEIIAQAGRLGIRAEGVLLHHPQIRAAVGQQRLAVIHHPAIDAGHRQSHADQQAQAHPGEGVFAPGVENVPTRQTDHGRPPLKVGLGLTAAPGRNSRSLWTMTCASGVNPARICA